MNRLLLESSPYERPSRHELLKLAIRILDNRGSGLHTAAQIDSALMMCDEATEEEFELADRAVRREYTFERRGLRLLQGGRQ